MEPLEGSQELLYRVASSPQFLKSKRLRELLLYLGERALRDPNCVLREQEIGADVLGRPPDYDTSHDTLVRVQVSQLRKKLLVYFAEEGAGESLIIDIPKGSYLPQFRPRQDPAAQPPAIVRTAGAVIHRLRWWGTGLVVAGIAALAWLGLSGFPSTRPTVDAFWKQLFGNGRTTYLVLSDVTLMDFENSIGRSVAPSEYETREFDPLADRYIADAAERALARNSVHRVATAMSDVQVALDFGSIADRSRLPLKVINARDLSSAVVSSENVVLLGSWRANPWVGLFEDKLAFTTDYQESPPQVRFRNRAPQPGEQPYYQAQWRRYGYCRVAYLWNPRHSGSVLLISGSDVISTEGGARLMENEPSLRDLRQKLGLHGAERFPHFEVLLRTQVVNSTVPWFEVVAVRRYKD